MDPCVKTERKCDESVNNEFKIMKNNLLLEIMRERERERERERANNETNLLYSCLCNYFLIRYFNIMNSLKSNKVHYILIQ